MQDTVVRPKGPTLSGGGGSFLVSLDHKVKRDRSDTLLQINIERKTGTDPCGIWTALDSMLKPLASQGCSKRGSSLQMIDISGSMFVAGDKLEYERTWTYEYIFSFRAPAKRVVVLLVSLQNHQTKAPSKNDTL